MQDVHGPSLECVARARRIARLIKQRHEACQQMQLEFEPRKKAAACEQFNRLTAEIQRLA